MGEKTRHCVTVANFSPTATSATCKTCAGLWPLHLPSLCQYANKSDKHILVDQGVASTEGANTTYSRHITAKVMAWSATDGANGHMKPDHDQCRVN